MRVRFPRNDFYTACLAVFVHQLSIKKSTLAINYAYPVSLLIAHHTHTVVRLCLAKEKFFAFDIRLIKKIHNTRLWIKSSKFGPKQHTAMKIGVLSDTHGYLDDQLFGFFEPCDEIWHAGDIGTTALLHALMDFRPVVAVYGNIDGQDVRIETREHQRLERDGLDIWMTHIGGYPGNYDRRIRESLQSNPPDVFISGHSHILKVMPDKKHGLLHINPGAAGYLGMHKVRTATRFMIKNNRVTDFELIELGPRSIRK